MTAEMSLQNREYNKFEQHQNNRLRPVSGIEKYQRVQSAFQNERTHTFINSPLTAQKAYSFLKCEQRIRGNRDDSRRENLHA